MPYRFQHWIAAAFLALLSLASTGCGAADTTDGDITGRKIRVVATTNIVGDLATEIGGDRADVTTLMGPGVDPHLYKASAGDVDTLSDADVIFYGGLELEGRMTDLFVELASERKTVAVTRDIPRASLSEPASFAGKYDPHIWFDVELWKYATKTVADTYIELDPTHKDEYERRRDSYLDKLSALDAKIKANVAKVPTKSRVLITSHDAFGYFGDRYGFDVVAIQGVSTASEATTADIKRVAKVIADRDVNAVFIESSISRQTIEAVLAAAENEGHTARIGGELYGDAAGKKGTPDGSYIGMYEHNIDLITKGLT
jgi:manganese/zinc/iron transport system substrate-binding protein